MTIISDRGFPVTGEATLEVVVTAATEEAARDILCKRGGERFLFEAFVTRTGHTLTGCEIDYLGAQDATRTETHNAEVIGCTWCRSGTSCATCKSPTHFTFEVPGFLDCVITALTVGEAAHRYEEDIKGEDYSTDYPSGPIHITMVSAEDYRPHP